MFDVSALESPKGRVELIETIGKGNFGYVYRGRITRTGQTAAVKVVVLKEDELREILLEVEILRDCQHPNVVQFIGNYVRNDDLWICMEYCGGGAVDSLYKALPRLFSEDDVAFLILETLKGLSYLHSKHIIHRDIKSGNLLITDDGDIKLADFGVSALTTASTSFRAHTFIGTPYWMAPEVIMSENTPSHMYNSKADIWSTGIMSIEIADKSPPLSDIHPMRALYLIPTADAQTLMLRQPGKWSKVFVNFIQSCLVKDPVQRPSADDALKHSWMLKAAAPAQVEKSRRSLKQALVEAREEKARKATNPRNVKGGRQPAVTAPGDLPGAESSDDEDPVTVTPVANPSPIIVDEVPSLTADSQSSTTAMINKDTGKSGNTTPLLPPQPSPSLQSNGRSLSPLPSPFRASFINVFRRTNSTSDITCDADAADLVELTDGLAIAKPMFAGAENVSAAEPQFDVVSLDLHLKPEVLCMEFYSFTTRPAMNDSPSAVCQFLLIGTEKGLYAADISRHYDNPASKASDYYYADGGSRCRPLILNTRFKQLAVLDEYGVIVALCGKYSHIRSYNLASVKKLLCHIFGIDLSASQSPDGDVYNDDILVPFHLSEGEVETPTFWANDYIKALDSRESQSFIVTRTRETCYLGVLFAKDIVVFEWAKLPYLRFMKVKQFWLPETPKLFSIQHDGATIVDLMVVYEREANRIEFESSKVVEISVTPQLKSTQPKECLRDKDQFRWLSWTQLPILGNMTKPATVAPTSWYGTMKQMKPQAYRKPIPARQFMATFGARTQVVDENGEPCLREEQCTSHVQWCASSSTAAAQNNKLQLSAPSRVLITPGHCILGLQTNYIEVFKYTDGGLLQSFYTKNNIKVISPGPGMDIIDRRRGRVYFTAANKKKKTTSVYWLCEAGLDVAQAESDIREVDRGEKAHKVIGTGTFTVKQRLL